MGVAAAHHPAPRFALVGCTNFLVSLVVFYLCYRFLPLPATVAAAVANVLAYIAGMINSFALNRSWTFRAGGSVTAQALRFTTVNLASLTFSTLTVFVLVDRLGYPELLVWVPLAAVIVVLNYLGSKHWAFAGPGRTP